MQVRLRNYFEPRLAFCAQHTNTKTQRNMHIVQQQHTELAQHIIQHITVQQHSTTTQQPSTTHKHDTAHTQTQRRRIIKFSI